jgi:Tfp pilus assembly protein PilV
MRDSTDGLRTLNRAARSEAGFMLVELLVAAMLVAVIAVGLSGAMMGASRGSGNDRHRSVAATIAQQDQERMRGFKPTALSNYTNSRPVTIAGTTYTVASEGRWLSDSSGSLSCSNNSATANYIRITSSVTWPGMGALQPITIRSLVAPPSGSFSSTTGTLAVRLTDQADNAIPGVSMTLGAPANVTQTTDSDGCVVFAAADAGSYPLTYSHAGHVDPSGQNAVSSPPVSVIAGTTTTITRLYAPGGSIATSFDTKVGSNSPQASQAQSISIAHPNLPAPGTRAFDPAGTLHSTINATSVFPFSSAYNVYAGSCAGNDPSSFSGQSNYFTVTSPGSAVLVAPGGSHSATVRQPAINLNVTRGGSPYPSARVFITSDTCSTESFPGPHTLNAQGALVNPGFPFGQYDVCVDDGVRRVQQTNVSNTGPNGTATINLAIPTSGLFNRVTCS